MPIDFQTLFGGKSKTPPPAPSDAPQEELNITEPDDAANILVWGPPGCGKSSFVGGWFYTEGKVGKRWRIRENDVDTQRYREVVMDCIQNRDFLFPTDPGRIIYLSFTFERESMFSPDRLRITVPECSGEKFFAMEDELLNRIDEYDGVLWLIDPTKAWEQQSYTIEDMKRERERNPKFLTYRQLLGRWLNAFFLARSARRRGNRRMAFCLTKMDHPDHVKWKDDAGAYFKQVLGEDAISIIESHCKKNDYKVFACSLAGLDGNGESNAMQRNWPAGNKFVTTVGEKLNCRPKPFGMFEPLEWLLGK